jgi:hypothetical protein
MATLTLSQPKFKITPVSDLVKTIENASRESFPSVTGTYNLATSLASL